jgi:hypothetical protein
MLYVCEQRLKIFENKVMRIAFGSKRGGLTGNEENYTARNIMVKMIKLLK